MKIVQIGTSKYFVQDKDDEINLIHELVKQGYSISQIAQFLRITEKKVSKILQDCW